jgi:hypothetical protein
VPGDDDGECRFSSCSVVDASQFAYIDFPTNRPVKPENGIRAGIEQLGKLRDDYAVQIPARLGINPETLLQESRAALAAPRLDPVPVVLELVHVAR